jgi:hypothetical protein
VIRARSGRNDALEQDIDEGFTAKDAKDAKMKRLRVLRVLRGELHGDRARPGCHDEVLATRTTFVSEPALRLIAERGGQP